MKNNKTKYIYLSIVLSLLTIFLAIPGYNLLRPTPIRVVCIGDSLTTCGGPDGKYTDWLSKFLPRDTIINKGIGGDTLHGGRERFEKDVLELNPDIVVIELGANDFWQRKRAIEQLKADLEDMVKRAKEAKIEVVIASCFGKRDFAKEQNVEIPSDLYYFGTAIGKMEEEICKKYGCEYVPNMQIDIKPNGIIPYWDDKNHPNRLGNEFVAKQILEEIKKARKRLQK